MKDGRRVSRKSWGRLRCVMRKKNHARIRMKGRNKPWSLPLTSPFLVGCTLKLFLRFSPSSSPVRYKKVFNSLGGSAFHGTFRNREGKEKREREGSMANGRSNRRRGSRRYTQIFARTIGKTKAFSSAKGNIVLGELRLLLLQIS